MADGKYGHQLYVWNWKEATLRQTITLDPVKACMPLEVGKWIHNFKITVIRRLREFLKSCYFEIFTVFLSCIMIFEL